MSLKEINCKELDALIKEKKVILIDVRELSEHNIEKIPTSICMPLSTLDPSAIHSLANSDKEIILHCKSGNRSTKAADRLFQNGFSNIKHLTGGIDGWKKSGLTTILGCHLPISLFRQVQIVAGSLVLIGSLLGYFVSNNFLFLSAFIGCGLLFAGITDTCALGKLLSMLPYNKSK